MCNRGGTLPGQSCPPERCLGALLGSDGSAVRGPEAPLGRGERLRHASLVERILLGIERGLLGVSRGLRVVEHLLVRVAPLLARLDGGSSDRPWCWSARHVVGDLAAIPVGSVLFEVAGLLLPVRHCLTEIENGLIAVEIRLALAGWIPRFAGVRHQATLSDGDPNTIVVWAGLPSR